MTLTCHRVAKSYSCVYIYIYVVYVLYAVLSVPDTNLMVICFFFIIVAKFRVQFQLYF